MKEYKGIKNEREDKQEGRRDEAAPAKRRITGKRPRKVEDKVDELKKASHELWETLRAKFDHNKDGNITQSEIKSVP